MAARITALPSYGLRESLLFIQIVKLIKNISKAIQNVASIEICLDCFAMLAMTTNIVSSKLCVDYSEPDYIPIIFLNSSFSKSDASSLATFCA